MMRGTTKRTKTRSTRPRESTADESVVAQLAALKRMSVVELKVKWESPFGTPAPNNSRSYLELRLGYRIQELTLGALSLETSLAYLAPDVLEKLLIHRIPPALSLKDLIAVAELPWAEQMKVVFNSFPEGRSARGESGRWT